MPLPAAAPGRSLPCALLALASGLLALAPTARAGDGWQPSGPAQAVPEDLPWIQQWCKLAVRPDGGSYAVAWSKVVGHNVSLRLFSEDGTPQGPELLVNEGFTTHIQDEPMLAGDADGNLLVCWSDRQGYDGDGMGAFGRVYDPLGVPLGPPFVVNQVVAQSQWEPMPAALPGGGWLVAFNGQDDGEAFFRRLAPDGTPLGGDVTMATFHNNAQVDAVCEVSADGVVLCAFVDFGANVAPGTLTNVFVRRFTPDGQPLDATESLAHESLLAFDQIDPRMAANGLLGSAARFWLVWQDGGNDGDGWGVFARVYGQDGLPLAPAFQVNQTSGGDQMLPEVDCDHVGNAIITWEDRSGPAARILARAYTPDGLPACGELLIADDPGGDTTRPQVRLDQAGERALFGYGGPGVLGNPTPAQDADVFVAAYARPALSLDGPAQAGQDLLLELDLPGGGGWSYLLLASFGDGGVALPDGRSLALDLDPLFEQSLLFPDNGLPFSGFAGLLPGDGQTSAGMLLPNNPAIVGVPLHFAALSLDLTEPNLITQLRHVTRGVGSVIQ